MEKFIKVIFLSFIVFGIAIFVSYYMIFATIYIAESRGFSYEIGVYTSLNVILELVIVMFGQFSLVFFRGNFIRIAQIDLLFISIVIMIGFLFGYSRGFYNTVFGSVYLIFT